jgi:dTDP-4-amino-4,6-dideoxygalactose transaminase
LEHLTGIEGLTLPDLETSIQSNYAYHPVRVTARARLNRDLVLENLNSNKIFPRRYFYPLIPDFQFYRSNSSADPARYPVAETVAREVMCLPIYPELSDNQLMWICQCLKGMLRP